MKIVAETEYREIPNYPGYRVGSDGTVWSRKYGPWRLKESVVSATGYFVVSVSVAGKCRAIGVHRLVATAFCQREPHHTCVRHKDGDKLNNVASNLLWGTSSDNEQDKIEHGRSNRGERHGNSKLSPIQVQRIREMRRTGATLKEIAEHMPVNVMQVSRIVRREHWSHI